MRLCSLTKASDGFCTLAAVRASAAPGDAEALGLAAAVDHRSLLGMLKVSSPRNSTRTSRGPLCSLLYRIYNMHEC